MKILIIMPWIRQGGAELIAVQTAYQLQKLGHQVRLAACFVDTSQMGKEAGQIIYLTFESKLSRLFKKNKFFLYFLGPFFLFWLVLKQARWADILFPHSLPSYWLAPLIGKFYRKKVVWLCNEPPKRKKFSQTDLTDWLMWRLADSVLDRFLVRAIDKVVVYSQSIGQEVRQRYGKKASLVRLGVEFAFFAKKDEKEMAELKKRYHLEDRFVLLMVGKLHPQKNQRLGIEVLAKVFSKIPQAVLVLVGEGPDKENLKIKSEKLKISDKVIFAGFVPHRIVRAWYALADLVLFPSTGQTAMVGQSWGFVPFEALCQERLSLVSQKSGAAEVMGKEKIGFVCPATANCFTKKVLDFYQKREKYHPWAKKGKNWVRNNLKWEKFGQDIEKELLKIGSQNL